MNEQAKPTEQEIRPEAAPLRWTSVGVRVLAAIRRYRKRILWILGLPTAIDIVKEALRNRLTEWLVSNFGHVGRWLLANPFSLLTLAVSLLALWIIWVALKESASYVASPILDQRGRKTYRPRVGSTFAAGVLTVTAASLLLVVYGAYKYYEEPFPIVMSTSDAWYLPNYAGADVYCVMNVKNYSDFRVPVTVDGWMTAYGVRIPMSPDPELASSPMDIAPWERHGVHFPLRFLGSQELAQAFRQSRLRVFVNVKYNDGKKDVVYKWEGRVNVEIGKLETVSSEVIGD
jgi:hypothetical protein